MHTPSDWIIDTPATETAAGSRHKECTICHYIIETGIIPLIITGDVDDSGSVTVADIVMMKRVIANNGTDGITGCNAAAADVDNNSSYTVNDIVMIKRIIANAG